MSETPHTPERATTVSGGTRIIGTYEIDTLISAGGMGEVYRGHNIHNGEPVAIKIVLPALAHDPKIVALFQKESTTLSRLSHEAIVRYHVFTNDPGIGRPCLVMEFVSGTPMSERIAAGPMPLDQVKVMLRRVASGLDKAHRAGVIHRDMSPDNIILEDGMVEHAKLIDFGIAKSSALGAGTLLQGQFAGKFNWVAPEQLGAFGGQIDARSDIYSLGLVAAAASKGAVLAMGESIVDAVGKRGAVPDLTGVDPALVPLLAWMLAPDPAARPESMAAVIAALDNPALVPSAAPDPNRTVISSALAAQPQDASPFGSPFGGTAPAAPPPVAAAAAGKTSLVLPAAIAVMLATSAVAYFSGAFTAAPVVAPNPAPVAEAAPKPEPANPEPPKPEPAAAKPAVVSAQALAALLAQAQDCGPLDLINPPAAGYAATDPVHISGAIAAEATEAALKAAVAPTLGSRPLQLQLDRLNPAICTLRNALPVLPAGQVAIGLGYGDRAGVNPDGRYGVGDNPVIDLTLPAAAGYLSVALVDGSGQVLHLVQRQQPADPGSLRAAFPLAEAGPDRQAVVVNPAAFGPVQLVVLQTRTALAPAPRIEPVAAFADRVKAADPIGLDQRTLTLTAP
ncbi:MAG: hypothetical protein CFE33_04790 [Pseudorhodobacter sp. PARRP1]|nr:MAG: hypothetical protein CFE33_04790 [Pseudorhodobacter sp. PARRP1]